MVVGVGVGVRYRVGVRDRVLFRVQDNVGVFGYNVGVVGFKIVFFVFEFIGVYQVIICFCRYDSIVFFYGC